MLRNLNATYAGKRILASPYVGILASQIAAETATGDHGPGILYNESVDPEYVGKYLRAWVTNPPTVGSLIVEENGAIEAVALPDGDHTFNYDLIVDDAYNSASYFEVRVGVVDATAAGATLTGTATLTPGSATVESNSSAPGVTFTGTSSFIAGSAFGEQNVIVPGCVLVSASAFIPGSATGGIGGADATADGAELVATSSFGAGGAIGEQNATAVGVALTGLSIFVAGTATGDTGGVVVWPLSSDVRLGVTYGPTGAEYTGTMIEGGGTYPTAESIAAAVVSALQGTTIPANIKQVNDVTVQGAGTKLNPWQPV